MGRWSQGRRRGGARHFGALSAPDAADFNLSLPGGTNIDINLLRGYPAGVIQIAYQAKNATSSDWGNAGYSTTNPTTVGGFTLGNSYDFRIAWAIGSKVVSPWSVEQTILLPT